MNKPSYINGHRVLGWVNDTPVMDDFSQKSEELIKFNKLRLTFEDICSIIQNAENAIDLIFDDLSDVELDLLEEAIGKLTDHLINKREKSIDKSSNL